SSVTLLAALGVSSAFVAIDIVDLATVAVLLGPHILSVCNSGLALLAINDPRTGRHAHPREKEADPHVRNQQKQCAAKRHGQPAPASNLPRRKRNASQSLRCWKANVHGEYVTPNYFRIIYKAEEMLEAG